MPTSRDQFDADLATQRQATSDLIAADTDYIAAVDALIANPAVVDLAAEDATVQGLISDVNTAKDAVVAAKGRLPAPPPPPQP